MNIRHNSQPRFEEVYPTAPFSELIRLSVLLAGRFAKLRARRTTRSLPAPR
jgi:hypothetical protein